MDWRWLWAAQAALTDMMDGNVLAGDGVGVPPRPTPMTSATNLLVTDAGTACEETSTLLLRQAGFSLEHIVSRGAANEEGFWYDQDRAEWVLLLRGEAVLQFEGRAPLKLTAGDSLVIAAHERHRVESTSSDAVWVALHYQAERLS